MNTLKYLSLLLLLSFVWQVSIAEPVPHLINYQGRLTGADGNPLATGDYTLSFKIYNQASGGMAVWGPQASVAWIVASVARVVGWVEARPDGGFGYGPSRAETHHLGAGIVDEAGFGAGKIAQARIQFIGAPLPILRATASKRSLGC